MNILTEKYATSLHDAPAIILFVGKFVFCRNIRVQDGAKDETELLETLAAC